MSFRIFAHTLAEMVCNCLNQRNNGDNLTSSPSLTALASNLKLLCSRESSVSSLCRKLAINRQQFARYLSGQVRPSAHNQEKIEGYFGLEPGALHLSSERFSGLYGRRSSFGEFGGNMPSGLAETLDSDIRRLRPYLGFYHAYFYSFGWQGMIMKTLVWLYEKDGQAHSKSIERMRDPVSGHRFVFKYNGLVTIKAERLFIVENATLSAREMALTILFGTYRSQATRLSGLTMGSSSASRRDPSVARVVYNKVNAGVNARKALKACGLFLPNSRDIPSDIKPLLLNQLAPGKDVLTALPIE